MCLFLKNFNYLETALLSLIKFSVIDQYNIIKVLLDCINQSPEQ